MSKNEKLWNELEKIVKEQLKDAEHNLKCSFGEKDVEKSEAALNAVQEFADELYSKFFPLLENN